MEEIKDFELPLEYDNSHRLLYHPEIHFNQGKPWTIEDTEYLCKFHTYDGLQTISFALGRTSTTVATKLTKLQQSGEYEYYKNLNKHW